MRAAEKSPQQWADDRKAVPAIVTAVSNVTMPRPPSSRHPTSLDALRLSAAEVEAINHELDQKAEQFRGDNRRQDERHPYKRASKMVATVFHPGGTTTRYLIKPRNISRTGLAFLHGSFLHLGTQLVLSLETLHNAMVNVTGQTVHCKFVRGNVHEIGVRFTQPIDLAQFILEDNGDDAAGDLPRLVGRVLFIEAEESDRRMMRFIFERLGVQVTTGAAMQEAIDRLNRGAGFDVIVADIDGVDDARAALTRLGELGGDAPVVATTADENHVLRQRHEGVCDGVLVKPIDAQAVAMTLLQHLPLAGTTGASDGSPLYSTLWEDRAVRPLVLEYLDRLTQQVDKLKACLDATPLDAAAVGKLCLAIKGSAGSYGYPQISETAQALRRHVDGSDAATNVTEQFHALAGLCKSACRARDEHA